MSYLFRPTAQLLLLLFLALVLAAPVAAANRRCSAEELRVMTYNIRLDTPADGPNSWPLRANLLIGQIRLVRPAILGVQEVLPGQRADLVAALPEYAALGGGRDDGMRAGEASPLFVDKRLFQIKSSGMFWLSPTPKVTSLGWDAAFRRVASWAHLVRRSDGQRLLAINTHWDHIGKEARLNSAYQLRDWIAVHQGNNEHVVLLGDFNASLAEDSLGVMLVNALGDAKALSLEAAIGVSATFNGWALVPGKGEAIDHVLVSDGLRVRRYHALAEHFDGRLASDHFPVVVDLQLPQSAGCRKIP